MRRPHELPTWDEVKDLSPEVLGEIRWQGKPHIKTTYCDPTPLAGMTMTPRKFKALWAGDSNSPIWEQSK